MADQFETDEFLDSLSDEEFERYAQQVERGGGPLDFTREPPTSEVPVAAAGEADAFIDSLSDEEFERYAEHVERGGNQANFQLTPEPEPWWTTSALRGVMNIPAYAAEKWGGTMQWAGKELEGLTSVSPVDLMTRNPVSEFLAESMVKNIRENPAVTKLFGEIPAPDIEGARAEIKSYLPEFMTKPYSQQLKDVGAEISRSGTQAREATTTITGGREAQPGTAQKFIEEGVAGLGTAAVEVLSGAKLATAIPQAGAGLVGQVLANLKNTAVPIVMGAGDGGRIYNEIKEKTKTESNPEGDEELAQDGARVMGAVTTALSGIGQGVALSSKMPLKERAIKGLGVLGTLDSMEGLVETAYRDIAAAKYPQNLPDQTWKDYVVAGVAPYLLSGTAGAGSALVANRYHSYKNFQQRALEYRAKGRLRRLAEDVPRPGGVQTIKKKPPKPMVDGVEELPTPMTRDLKIEAEGPDVSTGVPRSDLEKMVNADRVIDDLESISSAGATLKDLPEEIRPVFKDRESIELLSDNFKTLDDQILEWEAAQAKPLSDVPSVDAGHKGEAPTKHFLMGGERDSAYLPEAQRAKAWILSKWRRFMMSPQSAETALPSDYDGRVISGAYNNARISQSEAIGHQMDIMSRDLADFTRLSESEKRQASGVLAQARDLIFEGKKADINLATLQEAGLTPEVAKGALAVRNWLEGPGLEMIREVRRAEVDAYVPKNLKAEAYKKVDEYIDALKGKNYFPKSRYGNFYVNGADITDPKISKVFRRFETEREALKFKEKLKSQKKGLRITSGRIEDVDFSEPQSLDKLFMDDEFFSAKGFAAHFAPVKGIEGAEEDSLRVLADYIQGLPEWAAKRKLNIDLNKRIANTTGVTQDFIRRYRDDLMNPKDRMFTKLNHFVSSMVLAGKMSTPLLNLTQYPTMAVPFAAKHLKGVNAEKAAIYGLNKGTQWIVARGQLAKDTSKKGASLYRIMSELSRDGTLDETAVSEIRRLANQGQAPSAIQSFLDLGMVPMEASEQISRAWAGALGHEVAWRLRIPEKQRLGWVRKFTDEAMGIHSDVARPAFARTGFGSTAGLLRTTFPVRFQRILRNHLTLRRKDLAENARVVGRMAAYTTALGGLGALPLIEDTIELAESLGYEIKKNVKKWSGNLLGDLLFEGAVPSLTKPVVGGQGISISGAMAPNLVNLGSGDSEFDPVGAAARLVLGVPGGVMTDIARGIGMVSRGEPLFPTGTGQPYALEKALPAGARAVSTATRLRRQQEQGIFPGTIKSGSGKIIGEELSPTQLLLRGAGFQPADLTEAWDYMQAEKGVEREATNATKVWNKKFTDAFLYEPGGDAMLGKVQSLSRDYFQLLADPDVPLHQKPQIDFGRILQMVKGKAIPRNKKEAVVRALTELAQGSESFQAKMLLKQAEARGIK